MHRKWNKKAFRIKKHSTSPDLGRIERPRDADVMIFQKSLKSEERRVPVCRLAFVAYLVT